jgi:glycosyltransferase involved in cell wall biosynthesis
MRLGIDASNLRTGGGVTHLVELLRAADPPARGFSQVVVWGGALLDRIEDRPWLVKSRQDLLNKSLPCRAFWQWFSLSRLARTTGCDVLFVPGSSYAGNFHPVVTMSRNMLPFEWRELRRYGCSFIGFRLVLLRWIHARGFRRADGLVFLTRYASEAVMRVVQTRQGRMTIVPHGVDGAFVAAPREQQDIDAYSPERPFRFVYVSIVDFYKHQWYAAEAIAKLRGEGLPVALDLVGPAYPPALRRLKSVLACLDPAGTFIRYTGPVPHNELPAVYRNADACLFASSCENMPNILLEGMASGLPVASSDRGPMPEVLGDTGVFFDPENPESIAAAARSLLSSARLRARLAKASFDRAQTFSWRRCAGSTLAFLAEVALARPATTGRD